MGAVPTAWLVPAAFLLGLLAVTRRRRRLVAALLAVAVAASCASGCAMVKPWERGVLANSAMIFGANAGEVALEQHCLQYREGSAGGFGGGGGGCGCN